MSASVLPAEPVPPAPPVPLARPRGLLRRSLCGARRRWGAALAALVCAWSGVWLAVWLVAASAVLGAVLGSVQAALTGGTLPGSPGGGLLGVTAGAAAGLAEAFLGALRSLVLAQPVQLGAALGVGLAGSVALVVLSAAAEPWLLRLGGARRMSRREAARLRPLLEAAAADLELGTLPRVLMADGDSLRIRALARHLVVGRALLVELGDDPLADQALAAVLCHALHHWAVGDGIADRWVLACGLPLAAVYNAGCWLAEQGNALISLAGWAVLWPAWALVRMVVQPIAALGSRRREQAADAAVRATGRGAALHAALSLLGELEPGRSGWQRVMAEGHPPLELRLEALEGEA